jgi:regulation of enolase protein 1 (concanavalin A-like superfamily)
MDRLFQWSRKPLVLCTLIVSVLVPMVAFAGASTFTSDAFNSRNLMRPRWTFTDPTMESFVRMAGYNTDSAQVQISVPAGSEHDLWNLGYNVPRFTQPCANEDFTVEAKFYSGMQGASFVSYQAQGIVVEQDSANLIRFDFTTGHEVDSVKAFSAVFLNGFSSPSVKINNKYFAGYGVAPMWLRVTRTGNTWKMYYSLNGSTFTLADSFVQALNVSRIGAFAGNAGPNPAQFTMKMDYFFNNDSPIVPEEGTAVTDNLSPLIYDLRSFVQPNGMVVSWKTDEPADGQVDWGTTTAYTSTPVTHSGYFYSHRAIVSPMDALTDYHFRVKGSDDALNTAASSDNMVYSGAYIDDQTLVSDDFNGATVDGSVWTSVNPLGDASIAISGKKLSIQVPGGVSHDIWTTGYKAPRVMQNILNNANVYEWVVKFTSPFSGSSTNIQLQGVVVEQDSNNLVRFNFSHDGTNLRIYAGGFYDGLSSPESFVNDVIPVSAPPVWLRVVQGGGQFRVYYSTNGTTWTVSSISIRPMRVRKIGIFAGNAGSSPQAFTCTAEFVATTIPAKPLLTLPLNNAIDIPTPANLQWDTTASVATYRLQVSTDAGFGTVLFNDSTITATTKAVTGLGYTTPYYWRVRGKKGVFNGAYSDVFKFTTAVAPPVAPTLLVPADAAVDLDVAPTIRWMRPAGAVSFRVQVGTDSTFATGLVLNDSTITDTSRALSGLANLTKYFWRVNAKNGGGTSAYSVVRSFTTISAIPLAPVLVTPPNNAVNQQVNVVLRWNRANAAVTYRLQAGTDETFATGIVYDDSTLTDTTKAMSGLANSTKYYWRVNAKNVAGTGVYSAAWAFTTIVANPSIPVLVGPADGATNQDLTVKYLWRRVTGATSYRLQVASDSTFATGLVVNDSTVTDSTKTVGGLAYGMKYFWRINSKNIGGTSPYSSVWSFRTYDSDPSIPRQLAPADLSTGLLAPVTIVWTRPAGATSFHLQVATDSTFAGSFVVNDAAVADTFKTLNSLGYLTTYYWRVNADAVSGTSPFSVKHRFTTGIPTASAPVLVSPADQLHRYADSIQVVWRQSTPAVDKYWVDLAVDSAFVFLVTDQNVTDTTKQFRSLLPNQAYFWRVKAHNAGGWGPFSVARKFIRDITGVATRPEIPAEYSVSQNYPNPFNPATQIEFALPKESRVTLEVFNLLGQRVAILVDEVRSAGYHVVSFNASSLPSGLYLYRMVADQTSFIRKMMLVK